MYEKSQILVFNRVRVFWKQAVYSKPIFLEEFSPRNYKLLGLFQRDPWLLFRLYIINFFFIFQVGFTTKDVVYKWISSKSTEAVEQDPGLTTSEFDIGPIRIFESATLYKTGK